MLMIDKHQMMTRNLRKKLVQGRNVWKIIIVCNTKRHERGRVWKLSIISKLISVEPEMKHIQCTNNKFH